MEESFAVPVWRNLVAEQLQKIDFSKASVQTSMGLMVRGLVIGLNSCFDITSTFLLTHDNEHQRLGTGKLVPTHPPGL